MLALMIYIGCVLFYWFMAVIYYNSKKSYENEHPTGADFWLMICPVFNIIGGVIFFLMLTGLDKVSFYKILFLNFRKK